MTNPIDFRALCAELNHWVVELAASHPNLSDSAITWINEVADRAASALSQPEPVDLTDDELMDMAEFYIEDNGLLGLHNAGEFARVAIAADRARRPTPQPPVDSEVAEVLQWPAEWSRKQRAQEAEMLCCSAGMTPGKEMQQLVQDARDGMPLQHLHDFISHAIPTPQPPVGGEVAELVGRLKELAHAVTKENWREFDMRVPAEPLRDADLVLTRAAELLQRLAEWKASALAVERQWDANGIATMLGCQLGESQRACIQREVPRLLDRLRELEHPQPVPVAPTNKDLDALERKHWELSSVVEYDSSEGFSETFPKEETFDHRAYARAVLACYGIPANTTNQEVYDRG